MCQLQLIATVLYGLWLVTKWIDIIDMIIMQSPREKFHTSCEAIKDTRSDIIDWKVKKKAAHGAF